MSQEIEVTAAEIEAGEVYPLRGIEAELLVEALETYVEVLREKELNPTGDYDEDDLGGIARKIRGARNIQERLGAFLTSFSK